MLAKVKSSIQDKIYESCIREYRNQIRYQSDPYLMWIQRTEKQGEEKEEETYPSLSVVYMEQCGKNFQIAEVKNDLVLFVSKQGKISVKAFGEIVRYFDKHPEASVVYADEDIWMLTEEMENDTDNQLAHRISPWLKPMWSPDTLLSFQYFGHIFAVRKQVFTKLEWLGADDYRHNLYDFLLKATEISKRPGHIEKILFHGYWKGTNRQQVEDSVMHQTKLWGAGLDYDYIKEAAYKRRGIQARLLPDTQSGFSYPIYYFEQQPMVSIVIPSKDNLQVIKQCIQSIYSYTEYKNFEILVVDNGSTAQNRMSMERFREEYDFTYIYQPMEFNFSRMCNAGVKQAKGEYILLLNDDMEVIEGSWLTRMVGQASMKHVGAVGAKLLYPNSSLIQHAGVTNTFSGPGHKLKKLDDGKCYYYGRNKLIYDLVGVTAACLMIKKDKYIALEGLYEGLAVAYNDVDLCFRCCEKGWYNVQRNDVVLYHHESLSRGDDLQDEAKLKRLKQEMDILFQRHPKFCRKDPFIGTILNSGDPEFDCRWMESYELINATAYQSEIKQGRKLPDENKMNQAIMIAVEECGKEKYLKAGQQQKPYYLMKGWAYVPGVDNARYQFKLLLRNEQGKTWEISVAKKYRKDVAAILPGETNVELTGFCCWIYEGTLPKGCYDLWMTAKDSCSRQRLYRYTEKQLIIEE